MKWGAAVQEIMEKCRVYVEQVKHSQQTPLVSVLFEGAPGSGKTALASSVALASGYPFIKLVTPEAYIGMSEYTKCNAIAKVFDDAYKSDNSIVMIDNIERLLEYVPIGPRFSNTVLQTLMILITKLPKHGRRLLVLATSSEVPMLAEMGMLKIFNHRIHVPQLTTINHVITVLESIDLFSSSELSAVAREAEARHIPVTVSVKTVIDIAMQARQCNSDRVEEFLGLLEAECTQDGYRHL